MERFEWRLQLMISVAAETALLPLAAHLLPLATAVCTVCAVPAAAYVSDKDRASGNAAAIEKATKDYNDAKARGDKAGMEAAHAAAESARNSSGYSGGSDGSDYIPSGSSSGRSSSGGSSSGSSSSGGSSGSSSSTADKTQQMAENSAAWYVAQAAYEAAVAKGDSAAAAKAQSTIPQRAAHQHRHL